MKTILPVTLLIASAAITTGCSVNRTYTTSLSYDETFTQCEKALRPAMFELKTKDKAAGTITAVNSDVGIAYGGSLAVRIEKTTPTTIHTTVSPYGVGWIVPFDSAPGFCNKEYHTNLRIGIRDLDEKAPEATK